MATNKLYGSWTWTRKFPEPFDDPSIDKDSTDHVSSYNLASAKKSTLHCATLCGILAYMELEEAAAAGSTEAGAIGTQGDMLIAEYPSRTGMIHVQIPWQQFHSRGRKTGGSQSTADSYEQKNCRGIHERIS